MGFCKAHGAQRGHCFRIKPSVTSRLGSSSRRQIDVWIFTVFEEPGAGCFGPRVVDGEAGTFGRILTDAHGDQLGDDHFICFWSRSWRRSGATIIRLFWHLLFSWLKPLPSKMLQIQCFRHWNLAVQLGRTPLLIDVISAELHQQIPGHRRHPSRLGRCTTSELDTLLLCCQPRQASRELNQWLGLFDTFRLQLLWVLLVLFMRCFVGRHLSQILSILQLYWYSKHGFLRSAVLHSSAAAALLHSLFHGEIEHAGGGAIPYDPRTQSAALGTRQLLQEVLNEFGGILLPGGGKLRMPTSNQGAEHLWRHDVLGIFFILSVLQRWSIAWAVQAIRQLGDLADQVVLHF
mmetsp:Transcript_12809/g.28218  ORF Transcript_12809/g.28218 Transcript_12809/m.28218 type:complete len:347 (-) Transcript_12809:924-1964(-)